jgi:hypothetical protein
MNANTVSNLKDVGYVLITLTYVVANLLKTNFDWILALTGATLLAMGINTSQRMDYSDLEVGDIQ